MTARCRAGVPGARSFAQPVDIRAQYSPRAQNILSAAIRLVERDGADELSLRAVARESGEPTSVVLYHFSSMARLEATLVDALWHDTVMDFIADLELQQSGPGADPGVLVDFHARIGQEPGLYTNYVGLVAHLVPNDIARQTLADIYEAYRREVNRPIFAGRKADEGAADALAALTLAAGDGIPIDTLMLSRESSEQAAVFHQLEALLVPGSARRVGTPGSRRATRRGSWSPCTRPAFPTIRDGETASRLLQAGQRIIRRGGVRSLSLESCARESGESRPAVGYHFGSKAGFLDAIAVATLRDWCAQVENHVHGDRPFEGATLRSAYFAADSAVPLALQMLPTIWRSPTLSELTAVTTAYVHCLLGQAIADLPRARTAGTTGDLARLLNSVLLGLTLQVLYDPTNFDPTPPLNALSAKLAV